MKARRPVAQNQLELSAPGKSGAFDRSMQHHLM